MTSDCVIQWVKGSLLMRKMLSIQVQHKGFNSTNNLNILLSFCIFNNGGLYKKYEYNKQTQTEPHSGTFLLLSLVRDSDRFCPMVPCCGDMLSIKAVQTLGTGIFPSSDSLIHSFYPAQRTESTLEKNRTEPITETFNTEVLTQSERWHQVHWAHSFNLQKWD